MTFIDRLRFTRDCFKQAWYEGLVEVTMKAMHFAESPAKRRLSIAGVAGIAFGTRALPAGAANPCPSSPAQNNLVNLFKRVGLLLYVVGGIFCLVCFAWAAILFMTSAQKADRASRGMTAAKNTFIGLFILAAGFFMRSMSVHFVASEGSLVSGDSGSPTDSANSLLCNDLNSVPTAP